MKYFDEKLDLVTLKWLLCFVAETRKFIIQAGMQWNIVSKTLDALAANSMWTIVRHVISVQWFGDFDPCRVYVYVNIKCDSMCLIIVNIKKIIAM